MTTTKAPPPCDDSQRLLPTRSDHVGSWISACLILLGTVNVGLLVIWFSGTSQSSEPNPNSNGSSHPFNLISTDDQSMAQPSFGELLGVSPEAHLTNFEMLSEVQKLASTIAATRGGSKTIDDGTTIDTGVKDGRPPGGPDVVPHWQRWEVQFDTTDLANYTRQLDAFHIELGAFGGGIAWVDYASQLTATTPVHRKGASRDEERIYMSWTNGNLARFDRQLLTAAGIPIADRILVHFLPDELTQTLKRLEADTDRPAEEWQSTMFALRQTRDGYEWYVVSRTFR